LPWAFDFENVISPESRPQAAPKRINAEVAQLVEQLICNQQVGGSKPFFGFFYFFAAISDYFCYI
jgi:hypothetical protein